LKSGGKIKEIGIEYKQRQFGQSTVNFLTPMKMVFEMVKYGLSNFRGK